MSEQSAQITVALAGVRRRERLLANARGARQHQRLSRRVEAMSRRLEEDRHSPSV